MSARPTIDCQHCSLTMRDHPSCREEMEIHEVECKGIDDPRERFDVGDAVQYSEFGRHRLDRENRTGEVVGFSTKYDHCIRVQWDENSTATNYAHRFISHEGENA